ncbi:MAG: NUDIX hydrolase [Patescibacteria group bacterium]
MNKLKTILNKIGLPIVRLYWFIFRPKTSGVKCVIENNGKILIIRNVYGKRMWTFPGGTINKNETPENAVKREVREEVGLEIVNIRFLGDFVSEVEYKKDKIYCFSAKSSQLELKTRKSEILEADWFLPSELPQPFGPVAQKIRELYDQFEN